MKHKTVRTVVLAITLCAALAAWGWADDSRVMFPVPDAPSVDLPSAAEFNPKALTPEQRRLVVMGWADGANTVMSVFTQMGLLGDRNYRGVIWSTVFANQDFDFTPEEVLAAMVLLHEMRSGVGGGEVY